MSDLILFGVLRLPPELWRDDPLDVQQRHSCYAEAADRIEALERELAAARSDALEQITLALGEHIDTPIETLVEQILAIRAAARREADARAEQRKEDVRLLREMHGPQLWRLYGHGARWTLGTVADWLESQP